MLEGLCEVCGLLRKCVSDFVVHITVASHTARRADRLVSLITAICDPSSQPPSKLLV